MSWSSSLPLRALALGLIALVPWAAHAAPDAAPQAPAAVPALAIPGAPAGLDALGLLGDDESLCPALGDICPDLSLPERARNPFASVQPRVDRAAMQDGAVITVRFDGSEQAYGLPASLKNLPRLRVVGVLDNGTSVSVLAELEQRGRVILRPSEQIFLSEDRRGSDALWFTVKEITHNTMTLILKDGAVIHGNFF